MLPGDRRHLGGLLDRRDVRPSGCQDPVELARHDVAGEPPRERDDEEVGRGEGLGEPLARLIGQEADVARVRAALTRASRSARFTPSPTMATTMSG